jgi:hypothetical protein
MDKDLARLLGSLFGLGTEARVEVMVHLRRRPKQTDRPMDLVWDVEMMPDNGSVYRLLLEGSKDEGSHENQG